MPHLLLISLCTIMIITHTTGSLNTTNYCLTMAWYLTAIFIAANFGYKHGQQNQK